MDMNYGMQLIVWQYNYYYLLFNSDNKVHIYELQYKDYKW